MQGSRDQSLAGLLYTNFNQDHGCFACGMRDGFRVYNSDPLKEKERQEFPGMGSGVRIVEMLFRCNYLALVFSDNPKYPSNRAVIWDDVKKRFVIELEFASEVRAIRLRRDRIIVVLDSVTKVFSFGQPPQLLHVFETAENSNGLVALSPSSDHALLALPARATGQVTLADLGEPDRPGNPVTFVAHETRLACISLNTHGTLLATASSKGTLIRVFGPLSSPSSDEFVKPHVQTELRRGTQPALIYCINFSLDSSLLCASSDHGTVHVFRLENRNRQGATEAQAKENQTLTKFFTQATSRARFQVPSRCPSLCAFGQGSTRDSLIVITASGGYYKFRIDEIGDNHSREVFAHFLDMTQDA